MSNPPEGLDTSVPNVARVYDYLLGGKNNFEADRAAGDVIMRLLPLIQNLAVENRKFLRTAVRYLTGLAGIDQFLDIGVGLPTQGAVHEVAHQANPDARVAYVDYDPVVVSHASALLAVPDRSVAVLGDLRRPAELLADATITSHLDFGRPVGVLLLAVLHFIPDDADPAGIVAAIRDALAPGSYVVVTHVGPGRLDDETEAAAGQVLGMYERAGQPIFPRAEEQVRSFLDGFDLIPPEEAERYARVADRANTPPASATGVRFIGRKPGPPETRRRPETAPRAPG